MVSKLILAGPLVLLLVAPQTQNGNKGTTGAAPAPLAMPSMPPVKMGLWETTATTGQGASYKARSCFTKEGYQRDMAKLPPGCTINNQAWTSHSFTADVACEMREASSTGHIEVQFPDAETMHSTLSISVTHQGQKIPINFTSDSHFVSADCGELGAGESRPVQ